MDAKPVDDNATREPMGPSPPLTMPTRPLRQSGPLPTGEFNTVCAHAKGTMVALEQVSHRCKTAGNEIERLVTELRDMVGKL
jgi:hypothetical protein